MFWKIYFWIVFTLSVSSFILFPYFFMYAPIKLLDTLVTHLSPIDLLAVYGYTFKKKILNYILWRIWWLMSLFWFFIHNGFVLSNIYKLNYDPGMFMDMIFDIFIVVWIFLLLIPQYIAMFLYGYKCKDVWEEDDDKGKPKILNH